MNGYHVFFFFSTEKIVLIIPEPTNVTQWGRDGEGEEVKIGVIIG